MKALITKASNHYGHKYSSDDVKELNTIEDILFIPYIERDGRFRWPSYIVIPKVCSSAIRDNNIDADVEILIYDDYIE